MEVVKLSDFLKQGGQHKIFLSSNHMYGEFKKWRLWRDTHPLHEIGFQFKLCSTSFFVVVQSRNYRRTILIWETVGVGVIVIINQPLVWFFEIRKKNEQKTSIQWKCFLIILASNRSRMEKYMHRSLSQPQKQKKAFIGCKNWKNSSQSAAGGRKR